MRSVATQNFCIKSTKATGREHASINADTEPETEGYNQTQLSPEDGSAMRLYQRQWQYDQVGNILQMIHQANGNSWTRNYNYDNASNRLMSTEVGNVDVNYTYNEHGSMTAMPHLQNMQWDFAERLSHITRGTTEAYYNYDGTGQRVRKTVEKGNVVEERLYLGGFEIWRKKVNGNLDTERETLHIMDGVKRIAAVETKTVGNGVKAANPMPAQRYQLSNNIESATLELDENASIICYEEYYPYGETSYRAGRNIAEVGLKRYRYTGKEKDEESGLYYYGARYYSCWLGRWTATDPAGLVDGLNLYMYCRGSPVGLVDPNGTRAIDENGTGLYDTVEVKGGAEGEFGEKLASETENGDATNESGSEEQKEKISKGTVYITQGYAKREYLKNLETEFKGSIPSEKIEEANKRHTEMNYKAYDSFIKYAEKAKEKLETEGFKVIINSSMTEKEYIAMMRDPDIKAYYMDAHSNSEIESEVKGFNLLTEKIDFNNPEWPMIDVENKLVDKDFFTEFNISRPDLLLVYQISCANQFVGWSAHLGGNVRYFNKAWGNDRYPSRFEPKRIEKFADSFIKAWNRSPQ